MKMDVRTINRLSHSRLWLRMGFRGLLFLLLALLCVPSASAQGRGRPWSRGLLDADEFGSMPASVGGRELSHLEYDLSYALGGHDDGAHTYIYCRSSALMYPTASWMLDGHRTDAEVAYNQALFDLVEIHSRHLQRQALLMKKRSQFDQLLAGEQLVELRPLLHQQGLALQVAAVDLHQVEQRLVVGHLGVGAVAVEHPRRRGVHQRRRAAVDVGVGAVVVAAERVGEVVLEMAQLAAAHRGGHRAELVGVEQPARPRTAAPLGRGRGDTEERQEQKEQPPEPHPQPQPTVRQTIDSSHIHFHTTAKIQKKQYKTNNDPSPPGSDGHRTDVSHRRPEAASARGQVYHFFSRSSVVLQSFFSDH